jgi:hypothetical protein
MNYFAPSSCCLLTYSLHWKVDLTAYTEKHEFCFDAVLDERVSNDEVFMSSVCQVIVLDYSVHLVL